MLVIRRFAEADWEATWQVLRPVFRAGETYPYSRDITEEAARIAWIGNPTATYVAVDDAGQIVGTYYIRPNQPALGAHVCNCGYVVAETARRRGVATQMCQHSQQEAVALGFRAIQFNLVVTTNTASARLWPKLGFTTVGTLPKAFQHPSLGDVDALVMFKELVE